MSELFTVPPRDGCERRWVALALQLPGETQTRRHWVKAYVAGPLAVHRQPGPIWRWSVSHIATGLGCMGGELGFLDAEAALRYAKALGRFNWSEVSQSFGQPGDKPAWFRKAAEIKARHLREAGR